MFSTVNRATDPEGSEDCLVVVTCLLLGFLSHGSADENLDGGYFESDATGKYVNIANSQILAANGRRAQRPCLPAA